MIYDRDNNILNKYIYIRGKRSYLKVKYSDKGIPRRIRNPIKIIERV